MGKSLSPSTQHFTLFTNNNKMTVLFALDTAVYLVREIERELLRCVLTCDERSQVDFWSLCFGEPGNPRAGTRALRTSTLGGVGGLYYARLGALKRTCSMWACW